VRIELSIVDGEARLVIQDNGRGFNPDEIPSQSDSSRHFGLIGMGERARLLGGQLTIASATGEGTQIEIRAPMAHAKNQE
jgi:signal transduction histidine kinase